jgi:hypothetical protein
MIETDRLCLRNLTRNDHQDKLCVFSSSQNPDDFLGSPEEVRGLA